jgi:putative membrane protein
MTFLYIKALHIIFVVTWFAGLFYFPRLLIYFAEAQDKPEPEKRILQPEYKRLQRLLWYGITWPSAVITLALGLSTWYNSGWWQPIPDWLVYKLVLVLVLYLYHFSLHYLFRQQQAEIVRYNSTQLRVWNEVATVLLVGIVFLVVLKNTLSMLWGLAGLAGFIVVLLLAIRIYKSLREGKRADTK